MSLVASIGGNEKAEAVLIALIGLAAALGYSVVAEGVETPEQLAFLRRYGCDTLQGYYFSKPLPASQFEEWLRDRSSNAVSSMQRDLTRSWTTAR